jgi:hypothetical protein
MILYRLPDVAVRNLRRLARWLKVRRWWRLWKSELVAELRWKIDPWRDEGMY